MIKSKVQVDPRSVKQPTHRQPGLESTKPFKSYPPSFEVVGFIFDISTGKSILEGLKRIPIEKEKTIPMMKYHHTRMVAVLKSIQSLL